MRKLLFLVAMVTVYIAGSVDVSAQISRDFFSLVTNVGREFYVTFPPCIQDVESSDNDVCRLTMFGDKDQQVTVRIPAKNYEETRSLKAFVEEHWDFSPELAQPFQHFDDSDFISDTVVQGVAVHIVAEQQVAVHVESRFGQRQASYLALPTDLLLPNGSFGSYHIQSLFGSHDVDKNRILPSQLYVVAITDNTDFTLSLPGIVQGSEEQDSLVRDTKTITLNAGDVYCFSPSLESPEYSGLEMRIGDQYSDNYPIAVFASEYSNNPSDSSQFDIATLQLEPGIVGDWEEQQNALYAGFEGGFMRREVFGFVPGFESSIVNEIAGRYEYQVSCDEVDTFLDDEHSKFPSVLLSKSTVGDVYSHSLNAYPHGSSAWYNTGFYVSDQFGDSTKLQILLFDYSDDEEFLLEVYRFDKDSNALVLDKILTNPDFSSTSEPSWYTSRISFAPGVYYIDGSLHSVFAETGQALARLEGGRGGCLSNMVRQEMNRQHDTIFGSARFGCNGDSRVVLIEGSENCELRVDQHSYTTGKIYYRLNIIDESRSAKAVVRALSMTGYYHDQVVEWSQCDANTDFLKPIPNKNIHATIAPYETISHRVNFAYSIPGFNTLEDIRVEGSDQVVLKKTELHFNSNTGYIEIETIPQTDTGRISAIVTGVSHCGDVVELANVVIDIERGHLFAYDINELSTSVGSDVKQILRIQNAGITNVNIRRVEIVDSNNVFTRSNLQGLVDGKLPPTDVATLDVVFSPVTTGTFHAEIHIISDANNDTLKIPLVGHGRAKPNSVEQQLNAIGVQVQVQPHPATENSQLHIHSSVARAITVSFVNSLGQSVARSETEHGNDHLVDIPSSLSAGLWHAVLWIEGQKYSIPFVVE